MTAISLMMRPGRPDLDPYPRDSDPTGDEDPLRRLRLIEEAWFRILRMAAGAAALGLGVLGGTGLLDPAALLSAGGLITAILGVGTFQVLKRRGERDA